MAGNTKAKKAAPEKKLKAPYPISGEMTFNTSKVRLSILRVSPQGLVAKVDSGICHVGVHYVCQFELPNTRAPVQVEGKVSKTSDRAVGRKQLSVERMVEVLFLKLNDSDREKIVSFMNAIGQQR